MRQFWEKIENYNARLIPYALVALLIIIVVELFIPIENPTAEISIKAADYLIIAIFIIDLIFLAIRARSIRIFFRHYWLDIIAVLPFGLVFTALERVYLSLGLVEQVTVGQSIFHESLETEKFLKSGKLARSFKAGIRSVRVLTKSRLLTEVQEKHHLRRHKKARKIGSKIRIS